MAEPFDYYTDSMEVSSSLVGSSLTFGVQHATSAGPDQVGSVNYFGTLRMSVEHLKIMTFIIKRHLMRHEHSVSVTYDVPQEALRLLQIDPDEWKAFWS
jgi:hypothetical protein